MAHCAYAGTLPMATVMSLRNYPFSDELDVAFSLAATRMLGDHAGAFWEWGGGDRVFESVTKMTSLYQQAGMESLVQMSPTSLGAVRPPEGVVGTSFADSDVRAQYLQDIERLAGLHPKYLNAAAEINLFLYLNQGEFEHFQSLYQEAYERVKAISPATQVGLSYHHELFYLERNFELPAQLGPQDFIGFSSYPSWTVYKAVFDSIADIPAEYYGWIRQVYPTQTVLFTEIGWPNAGDGSLADQADFVLALPRLLGDVDPELVVWTLLHDVAHFRVDMLTDEAIAVLDSFGVDPEVLFAQLNSMGLLTLDGLAKPAWPAALSVRTPPTSLGVQAPAVPEPGGGVLLVSMGLVVLRRRRRKVAG